MPERTVRERLRRYGITARTRGGWNREDRRLVPAEILDDLHTRLGMSADQVGSRLGTSRSTVPTLSASRSGPAAPVLKKSNWSWPCTTTR